jgi:hypothetical protein
VHSVGPHLPDKIHPVVDQKPNVPAELPQLPGLGHQVEGKPLLLSVLHHPDPRGHRRGYVA